MTTFDIYHRAFPTASSLERLAACPGSYALTLSLPYTPEPPNPAAESGHRIHHAVATGDWSALVDNAEREIAAACVAQSSTLTEQYIGAGGDFDVEQAYFQAILGAPLYGTVDYEHWTNDRALVIDYKTGYGPVTHPTANLQLRAYAVLASAAHNVENVRVAIVQPTRSMKPVYADYGPAELQAARLDVANVIHRAMRKTTTFAVGDHCKYCPAKHGCQAYSGSSLIDPGEVITLLSPTIYSINELESVGPILPALEKKVDAYKHAIRGALEAGAVKPEDVGYCLKPGAVTHEVSDVLACYEAISDLVAPTEFLQATKVTKTALRAVLEDKGLDADEVMISRLGAVLVEKQRAPALTAYKP